jgi:hypothetical protein
MMMVLALGNGCATMMNKGTVKGSSADAQRLTAYNLETGLRSFRGLVRGKPVSLRIVTPPNTRTPESLSLYAGDYLREMVHAEGGSLVAEANGEVRLEIYSVQGGMIATERNFSAPVGQNLRIPLIYTEELNGESGLIVVARDPAGNLISRRASGGRNGETEYYLFRLIGPFRR